MTKIHTDALAAWDSADERARRAVLAHAAKRAARAYDAEEGAGQAANLVRPAVETMEVLAARNDPHLIATLVTTHRVYHYAQSGSDWSVQTITISEAAYDNGVHERVIYEREVNISESDSDDHDDAAQVAEVIADWRAQIARAVEHVLKSTTDTMNVHSGGWPVSHAFTPDVTVLEVGQRDGYIVVTTSTTYRIDLASQSGSDYAKRVVEIEETTVGLTTLATRTLVERNDQRGEHEDFEWKAFEAEAIEAWRKGKK